jgi:hypothetical protein
MRRVLCHLRRVLLKMEEEEGEQVPVKHYLRGESTSDESEEEFFEEAAENAHKLKASRYVRSVVKEKQLLYGSKVLKEQFLENLYGKLKSDKSEPKRPFRFVI